MWDQFTVLADLKRNVQLIATYQRSAFNRRTGELTNCCGASVNDDTQVRQNGIGVAFWPIGTRQTTYQVYDTNTERAWPAAYSGTAVVQGLRTYRFTQRIPVTVVQQMPGVPTSLLGLPGPSRNVVADRTFQASNTFWVDPRTGVPVKAEERILSVRREGCSGPELNDPVLAHHRHRRDLLPVRRPHGKPEIAASSGAACDYWASTPTAGPGPPGVTTRLRL